MTRRFVVRPKVGGMIAGAVFFGACTVVLLHQATHGPHNTKSFLLVMAALSIAFVGAALTMLVRRPSKELVITEKAVILASRAIRFDEVVVIEEHRIYRQVFLVVRSANQSLSIAKLHLPPGAYEEVVALVRTRASRV